MRCFLLPDSAGCSSFSFFPAFLFELGALAIEELGSRIGT